MKANGEVEKWSEGFRRGEEGRAEEMRGPERIKEQRRRRRKRRHVDSGLLNIKVVSGSSPPGAD